MILNNMKKIETKVSPRDSKEFINIKRKIYSIKRSIKDLSPEEKLKIMEYLINFMKSSSK